jgi:hypothetical protein
VKSANVELSVGSVGNSIGGGAGAAAAAAAGSETSDCAATSFNSDLFGILMKSVGQLLLSISTNPYD